MIEKSIAIVGSRKFPNLELVRDYVQGLPPHCAIVSGGAPGVDRASVEAAKERGLPFKEFKAEWQNADGTFDREAGFKRNPDIIQCSDHVVAFWSGTSNGTRNSIQIAKRLGKQLTIIYPDEQTMTTSNMDNANNVDHVQGSLNFNLDPYTFEDIKAERPLRYYNGDWSALSMVAPSPYIEIGGMVLPTASHAFYAAISDNPTDAYLLSRFIRVDDVVEWAEKWVSPKAGLNDVIIQSLMEVIQYQKFKDHSRMLLRTQNDLLPDDLPGEENLGSALMRVRDWIQSSHGPLSIDPIDRGITYVERPFQYVQTGLYIVPVTWDDFRENDVEYWKKRLQFPDRSSKLVLLPLQQDGEDEVNHLLVKQHLQGVQIEQMNTPIYLSWFEGCDRYFDHAVTPVYVFNEVME